MDLFELADRTARSFALTLRLLPGPVRREVCLAYLIARLTDSVADATSSPAVHRLAVLQSLDRALRQGTPWPVHELTRFAGQLSHPGEARLLAATAELEKFFLVQENSAHRRGLSVLATILSGQILDIERFEGDVRNFTPDESSLFDYTWRVAGCVGEFWTEVLDAKLPSCLGLPVAEMAALGRRYGQGLQLLNILRDAPSDWTNGRCYLPPGAREETDASDCPGLPEIFQRVRTYIPLCRDWLDDGIRYAEALSGRRVKAASQLPALLGHLTLDRLERADYQTWQNRIKVPRREVRWLLCKSLLGW